MAAKILIFIYKNLGKWIFIIFNIFIYYYLIYRYDFFPNPNYIGTYIYTTTDK